MILFTLCCPCTRAANRDASGIACSLITAAIHLTDFHLAGTVLIDIDTNLTTDITFTVATTEHLTDGTTLYAYTDITCHISLCDRVCILVAVAATKDRTNGTTMYGDIRGRNISSITAAIDIANAIVAVVYNHCSRSGGYSGQV